MVIWEDSGSLSLDFVILGISRSHSEPLFLQLEHGQYIASEEYGGLATKVQVFFNLKSGYYNNRRIRVWKHLLHHEVFPPSV